MYSVVRCADGDGQVGAGADAGTDTGAASGAASGANAAHGVVPGVDADCFLCPARGIFRKISVTPLVGDEVDFSIDPIRPGYGSVEKIHERRSALLRPPVANVDQLLIVLTLSAPAPDFLLADKLIIQALSNGIVPALCFNKSDLPPEGAFVREEEGYARAGFMTFRASHTDGAGMDALERTLRGKVTILAGQSGVGKSTLFNNILDDRIMPIGDMSRRIARGRHTTRHVELTRLKFGGWIVDSPGFSLFETEVANYRELDRFYPEFAKYAGQCKFRECSHIHEPGCAVLGAGSAIHPGRHARYAELYRAYQAADIRKYGK
ncbi:MAG: ribosome small subunit-dependent GTPase A [Oscillospiraceae bacterium]|nr:ribosome small subunit-dependent GTPase A [Oscillospiraceae bacterium]